MHIKFEIKNSLTFWPKCGIVLICKETLRNFDVGRYGRVCEVCFESLCKKLYDVSKSICKVAAATQRIAKMIVPRWKWNTFRPNMPSVCYYSKENWNWIICSKSSRVYSRNFIHFNLHKCKWVSERFRIEFSLPDPTKPHRNAACRCHTHESADHANEVISPNAFACIVCLRQKCKCPVYFVWNCIRFDRKVRKKWIKNSNKISDSIDTYLCRKFVPNYRKYHGFSGVK